MRENALLGALHRAVVEPRHWAPVEALKRLLMGVLCCTLLAAAASPNEVPALGGRVNDYAAILTPGVRAELENRLKGYEAETTHQIAVLTIPTLGGERIEVFSLRVANAWHLGREHLDNGVLVTIAPSERRVRIEIGTGMNRYVSDDDAKAVIEEMIPHFRVKDYDGGLRAGLDRLLDLCRRYRVEDSTETASSHRLQRP